MKFAYLIMAHDNPGQLAKLLHLLDHPENEIFLHVDKKSSVLSADTFLTNDGGIKEAKLHIYREYDVYWGDESQTKCQFFLLREAIKQYHDYYHLISGHDLPLKTHTEILNFFTKNSGKNFVHFLSYNKYADKSSAIYYHFLWSRIQRTKNIILRKFLNFIEKISLRLQRMLGIHRKFYTGANWFSITHELASDFAANQDKMLKMIRYTVSSDEHVLATFLRMAAHKDYKFYSTQDNDYNAIMRLIDWERGYPYVWKINNLDEIKESPMLFARKFDENIDNEIIDKIISSIK